MSYAPVNRIGVGDLPALGVAPLNTIIHGDCFAALPFVASGSIDMVLCDLPYATTRNAWDVLLPMNDFVVEDDKQLTEQVFMLRYWQRGYSPKSAKAQWMAQKQPGLWSHYERVLKPNGVVLLTASQPFTAALVMSNPKWFRYEWVWLKTKPVGHLNAKIRPMLAHESVLIFSKDQHEYQPQGTRPTHAKVSRTNNGNYGDCSKTTVQTVTGYPRSTIAFSHDESAGHPTQKPVALWEYLIKTYTHEGHTLLDNTAGSFTTSCAAENLNRNWLCIEQDAGYCEIGEKRINANRGRLAQLQPQ